jgi:catechol 2,3-dioxygenase-like lactoylglutathione lyase family enzyme
MIAILVREYDEAIRFYTDKLGFELLEDTDLGNEKRWVRVAPPGGGSAQLLLARAVNAEQTSRVGNQTGGRVFYFVETDDLERDYRLMSDRGVTFMEPPRHEPYGKVAVFVDLYGNKADLIEPI